MNFNPLSLLLTAVGIYLLFKLKFFFILHPIRTAKKALGTVSSTSAVRSLMLALAGTLGVGNVFGVCIGIIIGGRGSVFWLLVSTVFASVLKYSEVVISLDNLKHSYDSAHGGMYYTIRNTFKKLGAPISVLYACACLMIALVMGSALQSGTAGETMTELFDTHPAFTGFFLVVIVFLSIVGGVKIIEKITVVVIPLTTIIYIVITLSVIVMHIDMLGSTLLSILNDAFRVDSALGGFIGFLVSSPVREGYSRGILSNEAGCGTSSMAHSRSGILNPASAGLMGIVEVVFDTAILCMLTALAVLVSVPNPEQYGTGMSLILTAVESTLGTTASYLILFSVICFAYSTILCWYYYGQESFCSLFGKGARLLFLPIFLLCAFFGTIIDNRILVALTDALMLILAVLTLLTLIKNSDRIRALSEKGGVIEKSAERIKENVFLNMGRH